MTSMEIYLTTSSKMVEKLLLKCAWYLILVLSNILCFYWFYFYFSSSILLFYYSYFSCLYLSCLYSSSLFILSSSVSVLLLSKVSLDVLLVYSNDLSSGAVELPSDTSPSVGSFCSGSSGLIGLVSELSGYFFSDCIFSFSVTICFSSSVTPNSELPSCRIRAATFCGFIILSRYATSSRTWISPR